MVLVWLTNSQDMPLNYSRLNLGVSIFDCIMFWLWSNSFVNPFAWVRFGLTVVRVAVAFLLFKGVTERALLKCKIFCWAEFGLLILEFILLFFKLTSIGYFIYTAIVIALRGYGIWIIGGFVRILQSELGESALFPWNFFPEQVQNKGNISPEQQIQSPI